MIWQLNPNNQQMSLWKKKILIMFLKLILKVSALITIAVALNGCIAAAAGAGAAGGYAFNKHYEIKKKNSE